MKNKSNEKVSKKHNYDKGQIFVKIMAGMLALLMVLATCATLIYALLG